MSNLPQETYTLSQFINAKESDTLTYSKLSILQRSLTHPEMVYAIDNVLYTYMDEIKSFRKRVKLTLHEKTKYMYKPKLLSYDIYGSTELYFVLLAMNGQCNLKEFDLVDKRFYALTPVDMTAIINSIMIAEDEHIKINRNNLNIYNS